MVLVRALRSILAAVAAFALIGANGCDLRGSGYQYVRSRDTGTYMRVPEKWQVKRPDGGEAFSFIRVLDSDRDPRVEVDLYDDVPSGFVRVRDLSPQERDGFSFASFRKEINIDLDQAAEAGLVEFVEATDLELADGFRGQRWVFTIRDEAGEKPDVTISQTTIVNADTTHVHVLVVGCRSTCFDRDQDEIEDIAKSLTVKES